MRAWIRQHPLITFFALAYGLSWSVWIPMAVIGLQVAPGSTATHFPGLLGPALAAILTSAAAGGRPAVTTVAQRMVLVAPGAVRFWALALSPLAFLAVALVLAAASGRGVPALDDFGRYSGLPPLGLPVVVALVLLCNGFGEETGWRGFALPRLQSRFGPLGGTLVLAALWAGWHAPAFAVVETYRSMDLPIVVFGFGLGLVSGALVLSHLGHLTGGSVLGAAVWHAAYNLTSATAASAGLIGAVTTTCVMVWATLLLIRELRKPPGGSPLRVPAAGAPA